MIRTLMIGLFAVSLAGCTYSGVGSVSISPTPAGDAKDSAEPILTGTFDSVLSRKDGDVFTFTAYQRVRSRKGFSEAYRNYKKDAPFVNAELIVRVRRDGTVVGKPRLLLRQGENVLTAGTLVAGLGVPARAAPGLLPCCGTAARGRRRALPLSPAAAIHRYRRGRG